MNSSSRASPACPQMDMAEAAKHTPGPWLLTERTVYALESCGWRRGEEEFRNRFNVYVQGAFAPAGELDANVRLIAAAPDLLEALRAAEGPLRYAYHNVSSVTADRVTAVILPAISAAIAKATSQQPQVLPSNRKDGSSPKTTSTQGRGVNKP